MARFIFALLAAFVAQAADTLVVTNTCEAPACALADPTDLSADRVDALIACLDAVSAGTVGCEVTATITQTATISQFAGHFAAHTLTGKTLPTASVMTTVAAAEGVTCEVKLGASGGTAPNLTCTALEAPPTTLVQLGSMCGTVPTECTATGITATTTITLSVEEPTTPAPGTVTPGPGETELPPAPTEAPTPEGVTQTLALTAVAGVLAIASLA